MRFIEHVLISIILPLAVVVGGFAMVIRGKTPARIAGAMLLSICAAGLTYGFALSMAMHQDNGYFNVNIGWPAEALFHRLRLLSEQRQPEALTRALQTLDEQANAFPMDNRTKSPFRDLVDQILEQTSGFVLETNNEKSTEQGPSPYAKPEAAE